MYILEVRTLSFCFSPYPLFRFEGYPRTWADRTASNLPVSSTGRSSRGRTCWRGSPWASISWRDCCHGGSTRCCSGRSRPRCWRARCRRRSLMRARYVSYYIRIIYQPSLPLYYYMLTINRHTDAQKPSSVSSPASTARSRTSSSSTATCCRSSGA